jgi:hypothetical protein
MDEEKDEITLEIERMQNKILELEEIQKQKKKQKEIYEENSRKLPFENYFESLSEFIKIRYDIVDKRIKMIVGCCLTDEEIISRNIRILKQEGYELLPALANIYNALDNINKRLIRLEN